MVAGCLVIGKNRSLILNEGANLDKEICPDCKFDFLNPELQATFDEN